MPTWMFAPVRGCLADPFPVYPSISKGTWIFHYGKGCLADPIPALVFLDTFTDAEDTPLGSHTPDIGAGWTETLDATDPTIQGGQLSGIAGSTDWVADLTSADATIEALITILDNNNGSAIMFRNPSNLNSNTRWRFGLATNYAYYFNSTGTFSTNFVTGDNIGIEKALKVVLDDDVVKMYVDNVLVFDLVDEGTKTAKYHGVRTYGLDGKLDNFKITAVVP